MHGAEMEMRRAPLATLYKRVRIGWNDLSMITSMIGFHNFYRVVEDEDQRKREDIFKHRRPATLQKFPQVVSEEDFTVHHKCLPVNMFQLRDELELPDRIDRTKMIRIWRNMRANLPVSKLKYY